MKIALITAEYPPYAKGGSGFSSDLLVYQLRKRGVIVDVFAFTKKHRPLFSESGSTKYYGFSAGNCWPAIILQTIVKLLGKLKNYDLVHLISCSRIAALGLLKETSSGPPVVVTLNGHEAACLNYKEWMRGYCDECRSYNLLHCAFERKKWIKNRFYKFLVPAPVLFTYFHMQRRFARTLDKYFALSQTMKDIYTVAGFPEKKIEVIPNMYDPKFQKKMQRTKMKKIDDKVVILYVGRLSEEKGVDDLIRAFSKASSNDIELQIVGDGPQEKELRIIASASQMKKRIQFLGWVDHDVLPTIYRNADIFVHPGKWPEAFGRTLLEAMLAGLPVVASDCGAPPEILGDGGLIYRAGDITELRESLEILIEDKNLRESIGHKAYNKCIEDYSPDVIVRRILGEYEALVL